MGSTVSAIDWLAKPPPKSFPGVCVAFGDEAFLKRRTLHRFKLGILGGAEAAYGWSEFDEEASRVPLSSVLDCLATLSLFGPGRRVAAVLHADEFVTRNRPRLEELAAKPSRGATLVLEVRTWPSNTRLYKAVDAAGLQIECKTPKIDRVASWLVQSAASQYDSQLEREAAELMVEIVGAELGMLDQELAKLSAAATTGKIDAVLVRELVGGWRAKTAWEMIDAALAGKTGEAVTQLERLLAGGDHPLAVLGPLGWTLRQMAAAVALVEQSEAVNQKLPLRAALEQAGVKPFAIGKVETQLMRLGRQRGNQLYRWLLDADLAMKGASSAPHRARLVLETLLCRLAPPRATPA